MAGRIPPAPVLAVLSRYKREDIEAFIAIAIDLVDLADGDPDIEEDDHSEEDDPSGQCDEDEISTSHALALSGAAGCLISDDDIDEGH